MHALRIGPSRGQEGFDSDISRSLRVGFSQDDLGRGVPLLCRVRHRRVQ